MNTTTFPIFLYFDVQYFKDGIERLPYMDSKGYLFDEGDDELNKAIANFNFRYELNKPYKEPCVYSPEPIYTVVGFIYDGERIKIADDRELWKYSIKIRWQGTKRFKLKD